MKIWKDISVEEDLYMDGELSKEDIMKRMYHHICLIGNWKIQKMEEINMTFKDCFKCRCCGTKYKNNMESDYDFSLCKWCNDEMEETNE
tara:strand:+ start:823 stop:1089 length:267 start_codon:yes stop_codon:yes gene_type:complete